MNSELKTKSFTLHKALGVTLKYPSSRGRDYKGLLHVGSESTLYLVNP